MDKTAAELIHRSIRESIAVKEALAGGAAVEAIERASAAIIASLKAGGTVFVFGNGGSAADSQHMAAELVGRFKKERRALPAVALTTNTSTLTAVANDYSYGVTFSRQIEALGRAGSVAIGISTSGNSPNVLEAVRKARAMRMTTVCLTGGTGGALAKECDIPIVVPATDTPRIQEAHLLAIHILCKLVENGM